MTSILKDGIRVQIAPVEVADLLHEARTAIDSSRFKATDGDGITIRKFHSSFTSVIGKTCTYSLLVSADSSRNSFFYGGCAYVRETDELYVTSDLLLSSSSSRLPVILVSKLGLRRGSDSASDSSSTPSTSSAPVTSIEWTKLRPPSNMPMPSGAIPYYKKGVVYCAQGALDSNDGGLVFMPPGRRPLPLVTNYFGKAFNSVQSVVEDKTDGGLWFTDSCAGFEQHFRPRPQLPNHTYWFQPDSGELRVVADGLKRPTGITLNPRGDTLYITDTEAARHGTTTASTSSATIYAYDIVRQSVAPPFLQNRRIFAFAFSGVPAAVTCDPAGNVYAACGDGVEVWNSGGTAIGLIKTPGACSSLCFGRCGELFVCGGQTLWRVQLEGAVFTG
ncbi:hypothetical protein F5Y14DRAFT_450988 [Nemania sp. NC0429]|nr:hypothetical protein F5Y14DRAFT_450988 [Nemania sp. NC0429]